MPRCLIAKKWKAYPWLDRTEDTSNQQQQQEQSAPNSPRELEELHLKSRRSTLDDDEEIDVVGDKFLIKLEKQRTTADAAAAAAAAATSSEAATSHSSNSSNMEASATTTTSKCWGPSSPTAGTTAPSPPPHSPEAATRVAGNVYNGKLALGKVGKSENTAPVSEAGMVEIEMGRT